MHYEYINFDLGTPELNTCFKDEVMLAVDSLDSLFSSVLLVYPLEGNLMMTGIKTCGDIDVPNRTSGNWGTRY